MLLFAKDHVPSKKVVHQDDDGLDTRFGYVLVPGKDIHRDKEQQIVKHAGQSVGIRVVGIGGNRRAWSVACGELNYTCQP